MSQTIRFHLDEHVSHAIAHALRRRGVDVSTTTDAGLLGVEDGDQLAYATAERRVLVTHDPDLIELAHRVQAQRVSRIVTRNAARSGASLGHCSSSGKCCPRKRWKGMSSISKHGLTTSLHLRSPLICHHGVAHANSGS